MFDVFKKYDFTGEVKEVKGRKVYRIVAIRDIDGIEEPVVKGENKGMAWRCSPVTKGTVGGWIEREANLTHSGGAWVADDAIVMDDIFIRGNARVESDALCIGYGTVSNSVVVGKGAIINGRYKKGDNLIVDGDDFVLRNFTLKTNKHIQKYLKKLKDEEDRRKVEEKAKRIRREISEAHDSIIDNRKNIEVVMGMLSDSMYWQERDKAWKNLRRFRRSIEVALKNIWKLEHPSEWAAQKAERARLLEEKKVAGEELSKEEQLECLEKMIYEASAKNAEKGKKKEEKSQGLDVTDPSLLNFAEVV